MMDLLLIERRCNQMTLLNYVNPPTSLDVQEKMTLFPLDVQQKMTLFALDVRPTTKMALFTRTYI